MEFKSSNKKNLVSHQVIGICRLKRKLRKFIKREKKSRFQWSKGILEVGQESILTEVFDTIVN